jgi:hypothetical protein
MLCDEWMFAGGIGFIIQNDNEQIMIPRLESGGSNPKK